MPDPDPVTFHATVAHRVDDRERAVAALCADLRVFTAAASAGSPDWSSLVVEGPTAVTAYNGDALYVWTATVATTLGEPPADQGRVASVCQASGRGDAG